MYTFLWCEATIIILSMNKFNESGLFCFFFMNLYFSVRLVFPDSVGQAHDHKCWSCIQRRTMDEYLPDHTKSLRTLAASADAVDGCFLSVFAKFLRRFGPSQGGSSSRLVGRRKLSNQTTLPAGIWLDDFHHP